jgi:3-methyladenine DNA glycosylase AlkD
VTPPTEVRSNDVRSVLRSLEELADPARLEGMTRFGIDTSTALGVTVTELRGLARELGRDHALAEELWASGIHEARILASIVDDPDDVTERQMESWVRGFDSWDLCDQVCMNLFDRTPFAFDKAIEWSAREPEFEKRAGFALMASGAVHRKDRPDRDFHAFLPRIRSESTDERTYVKKAVSWALRQIGKRSAGLHARAIRTARQIEAIDERSARWIARDVLRELESPAVRQRLARAR